MLRPLYYECRKNKLACRGWVPRPTARSWELQIEISVLRKSFSDLRPLGGIAWSFHRTWLEECPRSQGPDSVSCEFSSRYRAARQHPPRQGTRIESEQEPSPQRSMHLA